MTFASNIFNISHSWTLISIVAFLCLAGAGFLVISHSIRSDLNIRQVLGPVDDASWLYGNLPELLLSQPYGKFEFKWLEHYGPTYRFKGCFSEDLLYTSDPVTLRYILHEAKLFDFTSNRNFIATLAMGKEGLLALRNGGETHRRVKNAFASAFTPARLLAYVPVVRDICRKATDKIMQQFTDMNDQNTNTATIDIYHLLQHITSDVIGEVGFGCTFNAVETNGGNELVQSHQNVVFIGSRRSKIAILVEGVMPYLPRKLLKYMLHLPTPAAKALSRFRDLSNTWGAARLAEILEAEGDTDNGLVGFAASTVNRQKRDGAHNLQLISQQTPLLIVAGQDTTANALAWALYELAKRPTWQDQVRQEVIEVQNPGKDLDLDKLVYLNAHIKETLRFHSSVPLTERVAFEDTILPLSRPITTNSGVITELPVRKGQTIYLGLAGFNRNPHVWGPDTVHFDPLRWTDGRYDAGNLQGLAVGPYSSLATFAGGARICLGWRLGVLEIQVVLTELLSKFRFSLGPGQEHNIVGAFALTYLPLDAESGKPKMSLVVQPI